MYHMVLHTRMISSLRQCTLNWNTQVSMTFPEHFQHRTDFLVHLSNVSCQHISYLSKHANAWKLFFFKSQISSSFQTVQVGNTFSNSLTVLVFCEAWGPRIQVDSVWYRTLKLPSSFFKSVAVCNKSKLIPSTPLKWLNPNTSMRGISLTLDITQGEDTLSTRTCIHVYNASGEGKDWLD